MAATRPTGPKVEVTLTRGDVVAAAEAPELWPFRVPASTIQTARRHLDAGDPDGRYTGPGWEFEIRDDEVIFRLAATTARPGRRGAIEF